jgi:hypothetical protein
MGKQFFILTLALVLVLGFSNASMSWMNGRDGGGGGYNYVDEDGDGICDNRRGDPNFPGYDNRGARGRISFINILDGEPFTYTGEVVSLGYFGKETVISTENGEVTLYGLGPLWYWDCKEIPRPEVGDVIEVSGYTVEYNSVQRNVVASVTIGGEILELRDPETSVPLWRGNNKWSCQ